MECLTPFYRKDPMTQQVMDIPCGQCPPCKKRRISGWSFRLMQENKVSDTAYFVTLTYNTDFVPITKKRYMSLEKTDLQKYFKRLRKLHDVRLKSTLNTNRNRGDYRPTKPIRYYACGEYGTRTNRPHYHIIVFNAHAYDIERAWGLQGLKIGDLHIGEVSEASVGYTLKYMCKEHRIPMHKNDDREPEFSLMSKGLGKNYITETMVKYHKKDITGRMYLPLPDGKKIAMPRYYKDKIYSKSERAFIGTMQKVRSEQKPKLTEHERVTVLQESSKKINKQRLNERM